MEKTTETKVWGAWIRSVAKGDVIESGVGIAFKVAFIAPRKDSRMRVQRCSFKPRLLAYGYLHAER